MTGREVSKEVEAYLGDVPEPKRAALERIRAIVWSLAPDAQEVIAYGIPTFKLNGNLVHYAAFKNHCSFFPGSAIQSEALKSELAGYKTSRGTIQFTPDNPLPDDLIDRIVRLRIDQNRDAAAAKTGKGRAPPAAISPAS